MMLRVTSTSLDISPTGIFNESKPGCSSTGNLKQTNETVSLVDQPSTADTDMMRFVRSKLIELFNYPILNKGYKTGSSIYNYIMFLAF